MSAGGKGGNSAKASGTRKGSSSRRSSGGKGVIRTVAGAAASGARRG